MQEAIHRSTNSDMLLTHSALGKTVVAMLVVAAVCFGIGVTVGEGNGSWHSQAAQSGTHEPVYGRYGHFIR